jgi:hypothetical protein
MTLGTMCGTITEKFFPAPTEMAQSNIGSNLVCIKIYQYGSIDIPNL